MSSPQEPPNVDKPASTTSQPQPQQSSQQSPASPQSPPEPPDPDPPGSKERPLDDALSLRTLKTELSDFIERSDSSSYLEVYPGTERSIYDFSIERSYAYSTNILESIAHLVKGCVGSGILAIHEGYMRGGLWASLGLTAIIGTIVPFNMHMLVYSAHKLYVKLRVSRLSYPDLIEAAFATGPLKLSRRYCKCFRHIFEILLFIEMCGTCSTFQIMIAYTLKETLESISGTAQEWNLSIRYYILIFFVPLFLLCMIRSLKFLAPFSVIADLFIGICVIATMIYSISMAGNLADRPAFKSVEGLLDFSGVFLYSIDGIGIVMPIENYMKSPHYYPVVMQCGMVIVIAAVTLTGFFGYWGYGESCRSPITLQMPKEPFPNVLNFLFIAVLAVSFAINFWVPFRIVWHYIVRIHLRHCNLWERIYRTMLVIFITGLTLIHPDLLRLIIFLGNFFSSLTVFIFPATVVLLVNWKHRIPGVIRWALLRDVIIIIIGFLLAVGALYRLSH